MTDSDLRSSADDDDRRWTLPRYGLPGPDERLSLSIRELRDLRPHLLGGEVLLPAMVMRQSALVNNLTVMAAFARRHGVRWAPHAKTTMSPQLMRMQLESGAWGISVANVVQAEIARDAGAENILIANEVVGAVDARWIRQAQATGRVDLTVLVDGIDGVRLLDRQLRAAGGMPRPVGALLEIGLPDGRTGVRDAATALAVATEVARCQTLELRGVETYEGVVGHDRHPDTIGAVDGFLAGVRDVVVRMIERDLFGGSRSIVVSAGGTRFVDRVVEHLGTELWSGHDVDVDLVVRPGSYLTYGHLAGPDDTYFPPGVLTPALEVWAEVLSAPEPDLAILGIGKKHLGDAAGSLVPMHRVETQSSVRRAVAASWRVRQLDDQHLYLHTPDDELCVGDRIGFGICYPTTLRLWRIVPIITEDDTIVDAISTDF